MYVLQSPTYKTDGRFFCITGTSRIKYPPKASTVTIYGKTGNDSDTSGYLSTSSLDSPVEETRLAPSKEKIKRVWRCWIQHLDSFSGPRCSTPNQDSGQVVLKKCVRLCNFSRPLSTVKRSACPKSSERDALNNDSFCTPDMAPFCSDECFRNTRSTGHGMKGNESKVQFSLHGLTVDEFMTDCLPTVFQENLSNYFHVNNSVTTEANIKPSKNNGIAFF
ncbi:hypothetical protein DPMN_129836 [Dreissena polymorpha]|uniref:Uncharacterized protein n=1 Tax=Dreissena polymorpha TaxID=45954 RepID=A0A9D4H3Z8_DREPO|nr:hypothetical protein DPMN_129836 [Dreissena polymorpha]